MKLLMRTSVMALLLQEYYDDIGSQSHSFETMGVDHGGRGDTSPQNLE